MSESLYPPLTAEQVNKVGEKHSRTYINVFRNEVCEHCRDPYPCMSLLLAVEWMQHHIAAAHDELRQLRDE